MAYAMPGRPAKLQNSRPLFAKLANRAPARCHYLAASRPGSQSLATRPRPVHAWRRSPPGLTDHVELNIASLSIYTVYKSAPMAAGLDHSCWCAVRRCAGQEVFSPKLDGDPLALADMLVLLPNRRACRSLRDAFWRAGNGQAMALPSIQPIGDLDPDDLLLDAKSELDLPPAIGTACAVGCY